MKYLLAAMDGMTTAAFRSLCFEYGADGATTEMIGALGFARAKRKMNSMNRALVSRRPEERSLAAQIIGSDPAAMAEAARRLEAMGHFDAIEINMGCPARKVTGSGNGSALLRSPDLAGEILRAVCAAVDLPVRLKLRLGWNAECVTAPRITQAAQDAGCSEIILHGRTREQFYRGSVDLDAMKTVCSALRIPLYANGAVTCAADARPFAENIGAAGVCIGRAALKEPWIFSDIRALEAGEGPERHLLPERIALLKTFAERLTAQKPENYAVCELRKYVSWWLSAFTGSERVIAEINTVTVLEAFNAVLDRFLEAHLRTGDIVPAETAQTLDTMAAPRTHIPES